MVTKTNVKKEKDVLKTWFTARAAKKYLFTTKISQDIQKG